MENFYLCDQCGKTKKQHIIQDYAYLYYCEDYCYNTYLKREIGCMYGNHKYEDHVWTTQNKRKVVSSICKFCGHKDHGGLKSLKNKDKLPNGDNLLAAYELLEKNTYVFFKEKHEAYKKKTEELHFNKRKTQYNEYILNSEEWKILREKILKRDNYLCQGCLTNTATQVHHHNYKNFTKELCFELISVCKPCHDKIHTSYE